jgi:mono/diheme cytochrome c family protein
MRAMQVRPPRPSLRVVAAVVLVAALSACAETPAPEVPVAEGGTPDPVLVQGRDIWQANCTRCHGGAGGGGAGPSLKGPWTPDRSPDHATMIAVVTDGRGAMPRFGASLSAEEIEAVVRYVREVL